MNIRIYKYWKYKHRACYFVFKFGSEFYKSNNTRIKLSALRYLNITIIDQETYRHLKIKTA